MNKRLIAFVAATLLSSSIVLAQNNSDPILDQVRTAYTQKNWTKLNALIPQVQDKDLRRYPEYWALSQKVAAGQLTKESPPIQTFFNQYPNSYLAERLTGDLLLQASRTKDATTIQALSPAAPPLEAYECIAVQGQALQGQKVLQKALDTYTSGDACINMIAALKSTQQITFDQAWPMIGVLVENKKTHGQLKRFFGLWLSPAQVNSLDQAIKSPSKFLATIKTLPSNQYDRYIFLIAQAMAARDGDLEKNYQDFNTKWAEQLSKQELAWIRSQFAYIAALRLNPIAHQWYAESTGISLSNDNYEWRIRMALRQSSIDWAYIKKNITAMPEALRNEPTWIYWLGRAHKSLGDDTGAQTLFKSIAGQHHFYGQLAGEELGMLTTVPQTTTAPTPQELEAVAGNDALKRALALFDLGWRAEAVREWNFGIRKMSDRELLAAAHFAHEHHIYDRTVNTSDRTEAEHDFNLRYLTPFKDEMVAKTAEIQLDAAWVYGLIRQESRFIMDARSGVGASGLMQLMPATAKWVAKKIDMKDFHPSKVNDLDVNLTLGTNYLNMVLNDLDGSPLLASAAYNAGPGRPINWRSSLAKPVEGAIFAETIPFDETRGYVKNVLSNATYYQALFTNSPQSLKERLGTVAPQAKRNTNLP